MLSDILEMASLDILNALGVGDRVVGTASTRLEYLQDYINDEIANLGTIKEAALEAVMACEPDVIFISGRLSSSYDALSEIAPVVFLATDTELGTDSAQLAQDIMENELVMGTEAYKNGHLVYLAHPAVWYTAEGGISALDLMLQDLENDLLG